MSTSDFIGQTLGQYRIEGLLDAGGMGQVFWGVHTYLNRPAAIKVMRPQLETEPKFRERFLQEARSAAALHHENIVSIYEFGEEKGQLYLIMELMTDGSLRSLLQRRATGGPWSLSLGLDLIRQAAVGLAAAHAQSMIHRDIKPDNLLLNRLQGDGVQSDLYQLKISDFGLARPIQGGDVTETNAGPMGTLSYMSPEQCQGKMLDGRSDLYSLGVVLYEVATGVKPFEIKSFNEAIYKHSQNTPTPPRQIQPDLPQVVEDIILRCLAKKPEHRFQDCSALAQALQSVEGNVEIETMTPITLPTQASRSSGGQTQPQRILGNTLPPPIASLPGGSGQPCIRVLDKNGQTLKIVDVTSKGIIIGRQSSSDLILDGKEISRQHLQVFWNGLQVLVKDLSSSNGARLEGAILKPQESQLWKEKQIIQIGFYWLRLESGRMAAGQTENQNEFQAALYGSTYTNGKTDASTSRPVPNQSTHLFSPSGDNGCIDVQVDPKLLTLTPGQPQMVRLTLNNLGHLVDWFTVSVEGAGQGWVKMPEDAIRLNPGEQQSVEFTVTVSSDPANRAQEYPVIFRAQSRENPEESGVAHARWIVTPFTENTLRVEPRRVNGRGRANYVVTLMNGGNTPVQHRLGAEDDEHAIHYSFGQEIINLNPGQQTRVGLTIDTKQHLLGREQRYPFQIRSQISGDPTPLMSSAEFVNKARMPSWVSATVALLLIFSSLLVALRQLPTGAEGHQLSPPPATVALTPIPTNSSLKNVTTTPVAQNNATTTTTPVAQNSPTATVNTQNSANAKATTIAQNNAYATATAIAQSNINATATATTQNNINATATATTQNNINATATATAQNSTDATATAVAYAQNPYSANNPTLVLNDPLKNNDAGYHWNVSSNCSFTANAYHSTSSSLGYFTPCFENKLTFSDFTYEVSMQFVQSGTTAHGGIIFRSADNTGKFYTFDFGSDGGYRVFVYQSGSSSSMVSGSSGTVANFDATQVNKIAIVAQGSQVTLYMNGQYLKSINDSTYLQGSIGIYAYNGGNTSDVAYTNARVWE